MTRQIWKFRAIVVGLLFTAYAVPAENKAQQDWPGEFVRLRDSVEDLRREVSALRGMLAVLRHERHREAIRRITAELEAARAERSRLAELDQSRQQDLRDLESLLAERGTDADSTAGVEAARSDLAVTREREIRTQHEAIGIRESELLRRLETETKAARQIEHSWSTEKGKQQ